MIVVRRREIASADQPEIAAPITAPTRSAPTNACASNPVGLKSGSM
jgi:hypothetical protein